MQNLETLKSEIMLSCNPQGIISELKQNATNLRNYGLISAGLFRAICTLLDNIKEEIEVN